jgi:hypothetical protein
MAYKRFLAAPEGDLSVSWRQKLRWSCSKTAKALKLQILLNADEVVRVGGAKE